MEGVTPGPWQVHQTVIHGVTHGGHWVEVADEDQLIQISGSGGARSYTQRVFDTQGHDDNEANARYIAACNPVAMREVLDELNALRETALQVEAVQREMAEKDERIAALQKCIVDCLKERDRSSQSPSFTWAQRARTLIQGEKP